MKYFLLCLFFASATADFWAPSRRTWWAKRVSKDLYVGGRPSMRDAKYLAADGFGTVISIFNFEESDSGVASTADVKAEFESRTACADGVADCVPGKYHVRGQGSFDDVSDWKSQEAQDFFNEKIFSNWETMKKPVYIHCGSGYAASFFTLGALLKKKAIDLPEAYKRLAVNGYDYSDAEGLNKVWAALAGAAEPHTPEPINKNLEDFEAYWWAKRFNDNWYDAGQILSTDMPKLKKAGYKSVVNMRTDAETINLVGFVKDKATTWGSIVKEKPAYADFTDDRNTDEFPFDVEEASKNFQLYDQSAEAAFFKDSGIKYFWLPIGKDWGYDKAAYEHYYPQLKEAADNGPVLIHCRTGFRTATFALLYLAKKNGKDAQWAYDQSVALGYQFGLKWAGTDDKKTPGTGKGSKPIKAFMETLGGKIKSGDETFELPKAEGFDNKGDNKPALQGAGSGSAVVSFAWASIIVAAAFAMFV